LGLKSPLREPCPYGTPPDIEIESETQWTINKTPREKADSNLCQLIMTNVRACVGCPMNSNEWGRPEPSEFLVFILELSDLIEAGWQPELPMVEWRALALLKRKRNQAEMKRLNEQREKSMKGMKYHS
jgi:hypothetical protein